MSYNPHCGGLGSAISTQAQFAQPHKQIAHLDSLSYLRSNKATTNDICCLAKQIELVCVRSGGIVIWGRLKLPAPEI
jgi:hypothetical protein